uniref:Uncharacterized protein n=1 Tax=Saimiri boliviensis boliviensis TaxID=39432 RepID=A0A2K6SMH5_SAIBB
MSHFCFHSLSRRLKKKCDVCLEILKKLYQLLLQTREESHQDPTTTRGGRSKSRTSPGSD